MGDVSVRPARAVLSLPLAAFCLLLTACGSLSVSSTDNTPAIHADTGVAEHVVQAAPFEDIFLLTGEMKAVHSLDLNTPRSDTWRVQVKWLAEDGAEVKPGDRLVEFDNSSVVSGLEEKKLAYLQREIDLESRQAALAGEREDKNLALERATHQAEKARLEAAVPESLSKRKEWQEKQAALRRAEGEVEKARLDFEAFETTSKSEMEVLRIARDKASRDIEEAQHLLEALSIKAPRDGIFIVNENWQEDRKFQVGDTSWPGMVVASIPDLSEMEVRAWLSAVDDGRIRPAMKARCVLDTYPDRQFVGKVEEVSSLADRTGFLVRITLEKSDPAIMRPGMSVRVEVVRGAWQAALTVPRQALRREKGKVFVTVSGRSEPVEVAIAACTPVACAVESGLAEGDHVVLR